MFFLTNCSEKYEIIDYDAPLENLVYKLNSQYNLYKEREVIIESHMNYSELVEDTSITAKLIENNSYNKNDKTVSIFLCDNNKNIYKVFEYLKNILLANGYSVLAINKKEYVDVNEICFDILANNYSNLRINLFESENENYIKNDINDKNEIFDYSKSLTLCIENMIKENKINIEVKDSTDSDYYFDISSVSIYIDKNVKKGLYEFSSSIYKGIDDFCDTFS